MEKHKILITLLLIFTATKAEKLLVDTRAIFPNMYAFIIQTEKDSAALNQPSYAINTDNYEGLRKGLWINVVGFGDSVDELTRYKNKYPRGYIRKMGQYRNTATIDRDSVPTIETDWVVEIKGHFLYERHEIKKNYLQHIIHTSGKSSQFVSDTFFISTDARVNQIYVRLFQSKMYPLIIERSYSSPLTGSTWEIRVFDDIGAKWCAKETFTNDGGPEEPINELQFDSKTDQPLIVEYVNDRITSQKKLSCNKR
ncbi:MAG: hypothetical protein ACOCYO_07805 [Bacteroidota bacterium]